MCVQSDVMSELPGFYRCLVLSAGKAEAGGRMHVTLCDYIMLWESLSNTQKKGLSQRYQMGCECKVRRRWTVCGRFGLSPGVSPPGAPKQT